jgi:hypothetical protein
MERGRLPGAYETREAENGGQAPIEAARPKARDRVRLEAEPPACQATLASTRNVRVSIAGWGLGVSGSRDPHPACRNNVGLCKASVFGQPHSHWQPRTPMPFLCVGTGWGRLQLHASLVTGPLLVPSPLPAPCPPWRMMFELRKHGAPITMWWFRALADGGIARVEQVL